MDSLNMFEQHFKLHHTTHDHDYTSIQTTVQQSEDVDNMDDLPATADKPLTKKPSKDNEGTETKKQSPAADSKKPIDEDKKSTQKKPEDAKKDEENVDDIWGNVDDGEKTPTSKAAKPQAVEDNSKKPSVKKDKVVKSDDAPKSQTSKKDEIDDIWGKSDDLPEPYASKPNASEPIDDIWGNEDDLPKSILKKGSVPQEDTKPQEAVGAKPASDADEKPKAKKVVKKKTTDEAVSDQPKVKKTIKKKVDEPKVEKEPIEDIWGAQDEDLPRRRSSVKEVPAPVEDIWASNVADDVPSPKKDEATLPAATPAAEVPDNKYPWRKQPKTEPSVSETKPDEAIQAALQDRIDSEKLPTTVEETDFWGSQPDDEQPIRTKSSTPDEVQRQQFHTTFHDYLISGNTSIRHDTHTHYSFVKYLRILYHILLPSSAVDVV